MVKKKFGLALISVLLVLNMTACSLNILDNTDVMRPPRATGNKAEIQDCIEKQAGGDYTLKYPMAGEYRTAIIMKDLNGDGEEESVALYRGADKTSGINVSVMDEINGSWQNIATFTNASSEIDRVFFCDLNGDGSDDIVVGWSNYGLLPSQLTAYVNIDGEYRESSIKQEYSELVYGSFTGNNCDSVILFTAGSVEQTAKATLVTMNDQKDSLKLASTADMNSNVVEYDAITKGYINKDKFGVVVDGRAANNHCMSQILYCEDSKLLNPLSDNTGIKRESGLNSCDINHDGIIEIPVSEKMPSEDGENAGYVSDFILWSVFDSKSKKIKPSVYTVQDEAGGFLVTLNPDWYGTVTARNDDNGQTMLYKWDTETLSPKIGELIFTVRRFSEEQWKDKNNRGGYAEIKKDKGFVYAAMIEKTDNDTETDVYGYDGYETTVETEIDYTLTLDNIKDGFIITEDILSKE